MEEAIVTRKRLLLAGAAILVLILGTGFVRQQPTGDALDPVRVASETHRIALENAFVRILDVHVPPGRTEPRHRHPHGLSVYFTDWDAKVTVDGQPPVVNQRKAGTFAWSEAVIHTVENVGKTEGHILRIELKQ
jgi:quercetin dioxygenase-like cupin family protein